MSRRTSLKKVNYAVDDEDDEEFDSSGPDDNMTAREKEGSGAKRKQQDNKTKRPAKMQKTARKLTVDSDSDDEWTMDSTGKVDADNGDASDASNGGGGGKKGSTIAAAKKGTKPPVKKKATAAKAGSKLPASQSTPAGNKGQKSKSSSNKASGGDGAKKRQSGGNGASSSSVAAPVKVSKEEQAACEALLEQGRNAGLIDDAPAESMTARDAAKLPGALRDCTGIDITKKASRKDRLLLLLPGDLQISKGADAIGELEGVGTATPVLYLNFGEGRLRLDGAYVRPEGRFLSFSFGSKVDNLMLDETFDTVVAFTTCTWLGSSATNPQGEPLDIPDEVKAVTAPPQDVTGRGSKDGSAVAGEGTGRHSRASPDDAPATSSAASARRSSGRSTAVKSYSDDYKEDDYGSGNEDGADKGAGMGERGRVDQRRQSDARAGTDDGSKQSTDNDNDEIIYMDVREAVSSPKATAVADEGASTKRDTPLTPQTPIQTGKTSNAVDEARGSNDDDDNDDDVGMELSSSVFSDSPTREKTRTPSPDGAQMFDDLFGTPEKRNSGQATAGEGDAGNVGTDTKGLKSEQITSFYGGSEGSSAAGKQQKKPGSGKGKGSSGQGTLSSWFAKSF